MPNGICGVLVVHEEIGEIITTIISIIKIAVPIILIIMGMIDFAKASSAGKSEDMAKYRSVFIKRCVAGVLVFFVISVVQLAVGLIAYATGDNDPNNVTLWECIEFLITPTYG